MIDWGALWLIVMVLCLCLLSYVLLEMGVNAIGEWLFLREWSMRFVQTADNIP